MPRFPIDAPRERVIKAFEHLGFRLVREGNHLAMIRENPDGTRTPLTMPNHPRIKGATLRTILTQTRVPRAAVLKAYEQVRGLPSGQGFPWSTGASIVTLSDAILALTTHSSGRGGERCAGALWCRRRSGVVSPPPLSAGR